MDSFLSMIHRPIPFGNQKRGKPSGPATLLPRKVSLQTSDDCSTVAAGHARKPHSAVTRPAAAAMGDITSPKAPPTAAARKEPVSFTTVQINYFREVRPHLLLSTHLRDLPWRV